MNSVSKNLSSILLVVVLMAVYATQAGAGWLDKINQVTSTINNTSQQVDNMNRAKQQVESLGSKLPKPSAKKAKQEEDVSSDGFELTKTNNPVKGAWGTQEKTCTHNSATCAQGTVDFTNCIHQTKGYYYRLVAFTLQNRIDTDPELTEDDRAMLKEDIASLQQAVETDKVIDPDPEYPQRYLAWLSEDDQHQIQKLNSKYMNEVRQDCDDRFGGLARYNN
jgi:hypothetical protein